MVVDLWKEIQASRSASDEGEQVPKMCGFCEEKPALRRCVQCAGVLCDDCERTQHSRGFFKTHQIVDLDHGPGGLDYSERMVCHAHSREKLSFYCLECRRPVCSHCLILGDHKNHQQTPIDQAFETGKETLGAWVEKLKQRIASTEELLDGLRGSEMEVQRNAEAQRNIINNELDHLRELIETKRQQLLSKSALEEKQKRIQLQAQVDRAESARHDSTGLVVRSEDLLALESEHAFLSVVLPLIQDMKKCAHQPVDDSARVSCTFRPLSTDAQVRSLGDLDLGHPRAQHHVAAVQRPGPMEWPAPVQSMQHGPGVAGPVMQGGLDGHHPNYSVIPPGYSIANATLSYLPQQPMPVQQVQYVYRTVPAP